ncbi:hypothetical protein AVO45_01165 [Ruegeria marisrubri]|uniref:Methyltransferase type 11 domain-containing protein n=2 Tax=Ruegeria marisrubri TaxID=1685379 RepID=A0A124F5L3_9RHOB|nr:hypothetical protein AVO45_01165 [Ruegeria marisrubri]
MPNENRFHLSVAAAQTYEAQNVPAMFEPLAEQTLAAVSLPPAARVLDVACGTGIVARKLAERLDAASRIVGVDVNPAMIEVARSLSDVNGRKIEFVTASAEAMPFGDGEFDLVFCQQGLQFFPDRSAALGEIRRVMSAGGKLVVTCWAGVPPLFRIAAEALNRHLGPAAAEKALEPFVWNDAERIRGLIVEAGFHCPDPVRLEIERSLPATAEAIRAELLATPNEAALKIAGEEVIGWMAGEILSELAPYEQDGTLKIPQPAHLFQAVAI